MAYQIKKFDDLSTDKYRIYYVNEDGNYISPFHDIPLNVSEGVYNMVCEIPKWTASKFEIDTKSPLNPIKQDTKKGKLREVHDVFPFKGYPWNYGCFPQTWEDPTFKNEDTQALGDNDPLDVCEIGEAQAFSGQIKQVKVLGCLAMIDDGETDWKVIAIDINDPLADQLNDLEDVDRLLPGVMESTYQWFRTYKIPAGKPENVFGFDGNWKGKEFTQELIVENYDFWKALINGDKPNETDDYKIATQNTTLENGYTVSAEDAAAFVPTAEFVGLPARETDEYTLTPSKNVALEQRAKMFGMSTLSTVVGTLEKVGQAVLSAGFTTEHDINAEIVKILDADSAIGMIAVQGQEPVLSDYDKEGYVQPFLVTVSNTDNSTIFGLYERPREVWNAAKDMTVEELTDQTGADLVAAGFITYANQGASFVFATPASVCTYVWDISKEVFVLMKTGLKLQTSGNTVAIGTDAQEGQVARKASTLAADTNCILNSGGVLAANGVSLAFQAAPLAFVVAVAGGSNQDANEYDVLNHSLDLTGTTDFTLGNVNC